ncbi:MAG: NADH-quinone oxidoreductase subunit K, partial [Actinobacteria bacterium]|nr:NADH-quinone oxidoreductase subunit K [Actinomycetota bacterium]
MVPIEYPLLLGAFLFGIGLYGALTKTNAIRILMCVELMLNAVRVVTTGLITHAALFLALGFTAVAGIFLQLNADFLA